ncbi:c-type cytochrome [Coralliovum pocilloporae]|uniref:c-type cytochrome n=1 Tax=Coralliovum pocilloporae TaxID=3066369 RepID=UPI0033074FE2
MNFKLTSLASAVVLAMMATGAAAEGDAKKGAKVYKKCKACHDVKKEKNKVGPHLVNIMGRTAGTIEGFKYSKVMAESGIVWDEANLDAFLTKPKKFMKGTKMSFPGLKKEKQRQDLIAYFKSLQSDG